MSMGDECGATEDSDKEVDSLRCDRYRDFVQVSSSLEQMEKRSVSDSAASDSSRGQNSTRTSSSTASSTSEMIQQPDFRLMRDMPSSVSLLYDQANASINRTSNEERKLLYDGYAAGVPALEPYAEMLTPDLESGISVLSVAASAGYCELVHVLLNCMRMGPDDRGPKGDCTPLMEAASAGHTDIVRCLVEHGADVNAHSSVGALGNTPLIYACAAGHEEAVEILLDAGADVDLCNDNGQTPLMEAAAAGHIGIAKLLVDRGARVNYVSSDLKVGLETPLTLACYKGHADMVKFLLKVGGENNCSGRDEELHTALMEASMDGHVEVAKLLLEAGAQVNLAADTFESPLTLAACGGHVELAKLYLSNGATLEEFNEEGYTPLMEASREGHLGVVRLLVEHGADVNMLSRRGESTLALAAGANFKNIVAYLLSKGADIERGASTALMEAAQEGNYETLNYLLESGANVHTATSQGDTAMSYAAQSGQTKICEVLLAAGASLEHQGEMGRTALMKAAGAGQRETVEFLLRKGANPNLPTFDNDQTALSVACGNGQLAIVDLLLQNGADPKVKLKDGSSCLLEAAKGGHTRVVQYLLDWPESSGTAVQYNSCCVIPPSTMVHGNVPSICDAETVTADSTVYAPVVTDGSLMTSSAEAVQAILANGSCSTTVMAANTFTRGLPLVVTPLSDYVASAPAGSLPPVNLPNLAVTSDGSIYYPTIPQVDGKKVRKHCTTRLASGDDSTTNDLKLLHETLKPQSQESVGHFGEQSPTMDDNESGCKSVKSRRAELDADDKELEQLKKTQKVYENLKNVAATHKSCANNAAPLYDRDYSCFSAGSVAPECKHLYETPCYRQVVIDPANANVAVTSVTDVAAVHKMELYAAAVDGQTDGETCHSSQFQFLHPHVNVVLPVPHSCAGQQSLPCNFVVSREENVCFSPAVSVAMVSVTASEAAAIYRNSSCYGYGGNVMPLEGVSTAAGVIPTNYAVANGEKLYIPVHLAQQDINSATFHGFAAGAIPTLANLPQGVIPIQARPAGAMVAVPTVAVNSVNAMPLLSSKASATSLVTNTITTKTAMSAQTTTTEADNKSTQTPFICVPRRPSDDSGKNGDSAAVAKPNVPPRPLAQDLELQTDTNHDTALSFAAAGGHEELVAFLLQRGANIEHRDKKGYTPLMVAASGGHQKVVELLIAHGANVEAQSERTKETALSIACQMGRRDVVEILLKHNANKEHRNLSDYTPMCLAAAGGCTDVIELLLQHGAEINSRSGSKLGISPLMLAAMNGNAATVKFLIDRGADINAQIETNRNTALTLACFQGKPEVVRILVEHRANVEHRAKTGFTPLMEAASGGFVEVGHVLLQAGADPNCTPVPSSRDTCLTLAADKGHNSFVDLLLQYTNQVDCRTKKGYTALWLAAHGGHQECVLSLIEAGADVDMPDNRRITPLMAAFRKGHIEVVKCLVDHVTQFPSDQDLARYQASITDSEVKQKCETAVEIIKLAKDRQAQMANKVAAGLLMEIEQEQQIAETRRQAKLRKKEKNRQKRLKKKAAAQQQQQPNQEETNGDEDESKVVVLTRTESNDSLSMQNVEAKSDSEEHSNEEAPPVFVKESRRTANSSLSSSRVSSYSISPERKSCPTTTTTTTTTTSNVVMVDLHVEEVEESQPEPKYADAHSEDAASKSSDADFIPVVSHDSRVRSGQVFERKIRRRRLRRPRLNEPVAQAKTQTVQKSVRHSSTTISTSLSNSTGAGSRQLPPTTISTPSSRSFGNKSTEPTNHSKSGHFGRDESALPCDGGSESTRGSTRWKTVHQSRSREETQDSNNGATLTWREVRRQPHKLFVSAHAIARVIGRGGQNINAIRESSGAHIEVEKQQRGQADRLVTIKGCSEAIKQAVYMINGLINEPESHVNTIINKVRSRDRKALESFAHPKPSVSNSSTSNSSSARSSTKADKGAGAFPEVSLWVPTTTIPASSTTPTKAAISVSTPPSATSAAFAHNNAWNQKPSAQSPKMNYASVVASKLSMSPTSAGQTLKMENDGSIFIEQSSVSGYRDKAKRFTNVADAQWCYGDRGDLLSGLKATDIGKTLVSSNEWDGGTTEQTDDLSMAKSAAEPVTLNIVSDGSMAGYPYSTSVNYPSGPISSVSQKSAASYPNIIDVDNGRHSAGGNSITLSNQGFCSPSAVQRPASAAASIESNAAMLAGRLTQAEHGLNSSEFANDTLLLHEANYPMPIGSERRLKSAAIAVSSANAENKSSAIYVQNQSTLSSVESTPSSLMNELFLNHCDRSWGVDRPTENGCGDVEKPDWSAPFGGRRFSTEWSSSMASFDSNMSSRSFAYDFPSGNNAVPPVDTVDPLHHHQSAFYGSGSLQQQQQQQSAHQPVPPPPVSASALIHPPYFSPNIPPPPVIPPRIKFVSPGYINGGGYPGESLPPPSARNLPMAYGYCPPPMLPSRPPSDGWNSTAGRRIGHARPNSGEWKISNGSSVAPHGPPVPPPPHAQHPPPPPTGGGWGGWNSLSM